MAGLYCPVKVYNLQPITGNGDVYTDEGNGDVSFTGEELPNLDLYSAV